MRKYLFAMPIAVLGVLFGACAGAAMTVEEYVEWCAPIAESDLWGDQPTWAVAVERTDDLLDEYRRVEPPPELKRYHDVSVDAVELLLDAAREEDGDDTANILSLFGVLVLAAGAIEEARDALDDRTLGALVDAGCIDAD